MPFSNGIEVTKEWMKRPPSPVVLICSALDDREIAEASLATGALAYIAKRRIATDLVLAVKSVGGGKSLVSL